MYYLHKSGHLLPQGLLSNTWNFQSANVDYATGVAVN